MEKDVEMEIIEKSIENKQRMMKGDVVMKEGYLPVFSTVCGVVERPNRSLLSSLVKEVISIRE